MIYCYFQAQYTFINRTLNHKKRTCIDRTKYEKNNQKKINI